jgi:hypothetical protein
LLLTLAFLVPLILSQSYFFGFYLPFQRFVYYLLIALPILAAVTLCYAIDLVYAGYSNHHVAWKRTFLKAASVGIVVVLVAVAVLQFNTVNGKLGEDTTFYSTSDLSAYQVGTWLKQNNPEATAEVVVSKEPGHWFWTYTGYNVTVETDPIVEWNAKAECVLDLSYELSHPLTMVRVYEAKTGISDENYAQNNMVWTRIAFAPLDNSYVSYRDQNDTLRSFALASLDRVISMDMVHFPKTITIDYAAQDFMLKEEIAVANDTYPVTVTWQLSAKNSDLTYATLYLSEQMDGHYTFDKAYIPDTLNWENPLVNPTKQVEGQWAVTSFYSENLTNDNHINVYDEKNQMAFALRFLDLPYEGNVGALANGNIDAIRWQYDFYKISANYTVTVSYQTLAFAMTSEPELKGPQEMNQLFYLKQGKPFDVQARNFASIIQQDRIVFVVYDINRLDKKILHSGWVEQVYANSKYVILKVKADHPYRFILENPI